MVLICRYIFLVLLLFHTGIYSGICQNSPENKLSDPIQKFAALPELKHAAWGLKIVNLSKGITLAEVNAEMGLIPASSLKILTTIAALETLGRNFRFETKLLKEGTIDSNGTLHGNLILCGGGDPCFGSKRWDETRLDSIFLSGYQALCRLGIKKIEGGILGDESLFKQATVPDSWQWGDIGNYFGAAVGALNFCENTLTLYFNSGHHTGEKAVLNRTYPNLPYLKLINQVTTGVNGSGDEVMIYGAPDQDQRTLTGSVPPDRHDFLVKGSISQPALNCARIFSDYLQEHGIILTQPASLGTSTSGSTPLFSWKSPPLIEIIRLIHHHSVNQFTEAILKIMALRQHNHSSGDPTDFLLSYWSEKGMDTGGLVLKDACGLSQSNRITVNQILYALQYAYHSTFFSDFYSSLAVAGKSGTLINKFKNSPAENNLRAKSGNMQGVTSFAGYMHNAKKEVLGFAIIINNNQTSSGDFNQKIQSLLVSLMK